MGKKLDLLFFKLTAGDVTARANGELTSPRPHGAYNYPCR